MRGNHSKLTQAEHANFKHKGSLFLDNLARFILNTMQTKSLIKVSFGVINVYIFRHSVLCYLINNNYNIPNYSFLSGFYFGFISTPKTPPPKLLEL